MDLSKIHLEESGDNLYLIDDGLCYVADCKDENGNDIIQWSNNYSIERKQKSMQGYLDNVCKICAWNRKITIKKKSNTTLK